LTPQALLQALKELNIEEVPVEFGGPGFRCAAWLTDGTYLPCVFVQPIGWYADRRVELIKQEFQGDGGYRFYPNPLRERIKGDLTWSCSIAAYYIERVEPCRFAIPLSLLSQVRGETAMSLWLFALETAERRRVGFSGGHLASMIFFDLPEDVEFSDFVTVRNVDRNKRLPKCEANFRERMFFNCFADDEPPSQADLSWLEAET